MKWSQQLPREAEQEESLVFEEQDDDDDDNGYPYCRVATMLSRLVEYQ
jgi:hypothetical protein